ncbi:DUF2922 domain-containing protein [Sporosarcina limicola]|uniref:DUF2922 domain-containing protein n=1 Tax=Sporosarcina limicola TaxID=34101 RepID=A0A927R5G0_9BACL|nr:DUF2922 domain-containing protein [Sporosarcina limicola]MBE1553874.1 hypothetical protein [Sporosarcina limicola]
MTKTLQLNFSTAAGKKIMLTVDNPRAGLTALEVNTAMQGIISAAVFEVNGLPLNEAHGARIVERNIAELVNG